jgi:tetratricopeptide (TPR) repeat protein
MKNSKVNILIILFLTSALGIVLVSLNWKSSKIDYSIEKKVETDTFSSADLFLHLSEDVADAGFTIEKDFPIKSINKLTDSDSLEKLIDRATIQGIPSLGAFYYNRLFDLKSIDSLILESAKFFIVAGTMANKDQKAMNYYVQAQKNLEVFLKNNPQNNTAKVLKGYTMVRTQPAPMQGIGMLLEVLKEEPDNIDALYLLGEFSIESQQWQKALERFKKLLSLQPQNPEYLFKLSEIYGRMEQKDSASFYLKQAIDLKKGSNN